MPPPHDVHKLISKTCDYVTLHDKGDFVDVIKGLEIGLFSWTIHRGPKRNHKDPHKKKARGRM